jgi:hypothetical protein
MVLSLITPAGSNFLKDFPAQNTINCNTIDAYANSCLTTHSLHLSNPVVSASITDPVLGVGGYSKAYSYEIFDQVTMFGEVRFGSSGFSVGSGSYFLELPYIVNAVVPASTAFSLAPVIGVGSTYDQSSNAGRLPLTVQLRTTSSVRFGIRMNSGTGVRDLQSTGYTTWAANDGWSWTARFQRVP